MKAFSCAVVSVMISLLVMLCCYPDTHVFPTTEFTRVWLLLYFSMSLGLEITD